MASTFYLLRSKDSAVGDGSYLGTDGDGNLAMVATHLEAKRFATIDAAEQAVVSAGNSLGGFEIEVRTSDES
jgi:hypothetical protein